MKILKFLGLVVGSMLTIPYVKELVGDGGTALGNINSTNEKELQLLDNIVVLDDMPWSQDAVW